jgi:hypothetical protein
MRNCVTYSIDQETAFTTLASFHLGHTRGATIRKTPTSRLNRLHPRLFSANRFHICDYTLTRSSKTTCRYYYRSTPTDLCVTCVHEFP